MNKYANKQICIPELTEENFSTLKSGSTALLINNLRTNALGLF